MALSDPREVERRVDELRAQMQATLADTDKPEQDRRDAVMRMTGEITALEVQARELREHELEQARASIAGNGATIGRSDDPQAEKVAAFNKFVKNGEINNAALTTTPDANGGYLMPDPMRESVIDIVRTVNPVIDEATVFTLTKPGTFEIELPRKLTSTVGGWVGETAARPATDAPTLAQQKLKAHEWYAYPEVTQSFLDAVAGAEDFLVSDIADTMAATIGSAFVAGTGDANNQPTGIFSTAGVAFYQSQLSSTAASVDAQQLLNAYFALPAKFLPTAKWYANGGTLAALAALTWPNLGDTPLVRWEGGVPTIMGKPVVILDGAPASGAAAYPLAFGDMRRGYAVAVHSQLTVLRDPYTNKPYVGFYSTGRVGGVPWDPKALLLLKSNNA